MWNYPRAFNFTKFHGPSWHIRHISSISTAIAIPSALPICRVVSRRTYSALMASTRFTWNALHLYYSHFTCDLSWRLRATQSNRIASRLSSGKVSYKTAWAYVHIHEGCLPTIGLYFAQLWELLDCGAFTLINPHKCIASEWARFWHCTTLKVFKNMC